MADREAVDGDAERLVELLRGDPEALELVARLVARLTRGRAIAPATLGRRRRRSRRTK
jgi:hypothetical protein